MSFPDSVAVEALTLCGRCCCICHRFRGPKMELHHIEPKSNGGDDSLENCIPLCFDCHSDMGKADPKHPKGKRYSAEELKRHRNNWYEKIKSSPASVCETTISSEDRELFRKICEMFSSDICECLSECSFFGTHPRHIFDEIDRFFQTDNPFDKFINAALEKLRATLKSAWKHFIGRRAQDTFTEEVSGEMCGVTNLWILNHRSERYYSEEEFNKVRAIFEKDAELLSDSASSAWNAYREFVHQGRYILSQ